MFQTLLEALEDLHRRSIEIQNAARFLNNTFLANNFDIMIPGML